MTFESPRLNIMRLFTNLIVALVGAYGLSVTGFLLLRLLTGEDLWLVRLFNNYAHLLIIPAVVLVPLCLLLRRIRVIVLLLAPLLSFLLSYAVLFTPRAVSAEATPIRFLSYNLLYSNMDLDALGAIIEQANADVVALQELTHETSPYIQTRFAETYPYQALYPRTGAQGQGILSRYPILEEEYWQILHGHQRAVLNVDSVPVVIYNTHPPIPHIALRSSSVEQRSVEIQSVLDRAQQDEGAVVLIGDFNVTDQGQDYWKVASNYQDAYRAVGWGMGFTFPEFSAYRPSFAFLPPLARLDYVFYNDDLEAVEAFVWPESGGSDHRPLYVELALN